MSWQISIVRAKPDPVGKDRARAGSIHPSQLLGEWVDLKNTGDDPVAFGVLNISHSTFGVGCVERKRYDIYWSGTGGELLLPSQVVRVHAGRLADSGAMKPEDRSGVEWHGYTGRRCYELNNRCGDRIGVWWKDSGGKWHLEDEALYDPNPPEGAVLVRRGNRLVALRVRV